MFDDSDYEKLKHLKNEQGDDEADDELPMAS